MKMGLLRWFRSVKPRSKICICILIGLLIYICYMTGFLEYSFQIPFMFYKYPLDIDMKELVKTIKQQRPAGVEPINKYPYRHILNNEEKCSNGDIFLLLVVKSAANNLTPRSFIRNTWGKDRTVLGKKIVTIFIVGQHPGNSNLQQDLRREHDHFKDTIQDNFVDAYWNNTIKLMQGFNWASEYCGHAEYLVFADDDYYIKPENLVSYLLNTAEKPVISGFIWQSSTPLRYKWSKWYTPLSEYPYWFWPPYPAGGCFALPMKTAVDMNIAMQYTKFIRFDDVFLGIVAWKLDIRMEPSKHFYANKVPYSKLAYKDLIASHGYGDSSEMANIWRFENS